MRILKTFLSIQHLAKYIKVPMVGKKAEDKAVGISRGGRNTKIHALVDGLGNPPAFMLSSGAETILSMPFLCYSRLTLREAIFWEIRHTVQRRFESILPPKMPRIPFHRESGAIPHGRWIGIPTKSVIWLSAFSKNSSGFAEFSPVMTSSIRRSLLSFTSAPLPSCWNNTKHAYF